jgi:hypothetical protein
MSGPWQFAGSADYAALSAMETYMKVMEMEMESTEMEMESMEKPLGVGICPDCIWLSRCGKSNYVAAVFPARGQSMQHIYLITLKVTDY